MAEGLISSVEYHFISFHLYDLYLVCMYSSNKIFILVHTGKVKFHWIFSESHHRKGEHDGYGATVKSTFRFFVLGGKYTNINNINNILTIKYKR